ncbi:surface lipoprotein assembly modifier [Sphingomonas morindae]|uniref:Surface lipoprotein assembly modifier n=1 Tax=Sphingomonas morindae TaxID=1541170 RepID=A0ABY4X9R1_9SPHN|nr:surface lipoprotein assembly modifier [Sphingomonas morindae]USI73658.1 surface lipoprotein assembly modifier [Sphingomonas morindae]
MLCMIATPGGARAQPTAPLDTGLRLGEAAERRKAAADARAAAAAADTAAIAIDGAPQDGGSNANDLGAALYLSLVRQRWAEARRLLDAYRTLPDRDAALLLYAEAALARAQGDLARATDTYRALLARQPDLLPARLELARALFLDHRDREAARLFDDLRRELATQGDKAAGVLRTVELFRGALRKRRGVQAMLSIGPGYSSNLNQSSASATCLLAGDDGGCLIDRKVPAPIAAAGINIEANAAWRRPLGGRSGIAARALLFGDVYPGNHAYSQTSLSLYAGYDRRSARTGLVLAPSYDLGTLGAARLYEAWGGHGEFGVAIGPRALVRLEANLRHFAYRRDDYQDFSGRQADLALTGWYTLPHGWTLFAGPDLVDKSARDAVNAYRQYGGRVGLVKTIGAAAELLLTASVRQRDYAAYSALLDATRRDTEQTYSLLARWPGLRLAGFSPSLLAQHGRTASTVDWLYAYRRTSLSVRIDHVL